jgi:undecaprenyl diphosphate synthase
MTLTIAISYGGMWDMAHAAKCIAQDVLAGKVQTNHINVDLFDKYVSLNDLPAVDLLIRTGGLSPFKFLIVASCICRIVLYRNFMARVYSRRIGLRISCFFRT